MIQRVILSERKEGYGHQGRSNKVVLVRDLASHLCGDSSGIARNADSSSYRTDLYFSHGRQVCSIDPASADRVDFAVLSCDPPCLLLLDDCIPTWAQMPFPSSVAACMPSVDPVPSRPCSLAVWVVLDPRSESVKVSSFWSASTCSLAKAFWSSEVDGLEMDACLTRSVA